MPKNAKWQQAEQKLATKDVTFYTRPMVCESQTCWNAQKTNNKTHYSYQITLDTEFTVNGFPVNFKVFGRQYKPGFIRNNQIIINVNNLLYSIISNLEVMFVSVVGRLIFLTVWTVWGDVLTCTSILHDRNVTAGPQQGFDDVTVRKHGVGTLHIRIEIEMHTDIHNYIHLLIYILNNTFKSDNLSERNSETCQSILIRLVI